MPPSTPPGFQPKKSLRNVPARITPTKNIVIYVCPTEGCPNYYGAPDFRADRADIGRMQHHRSQNDGRQVASHSRTECPFCREKGSHVQRVPHIVTEMVPLEPMVQAVKVHKEAEGAAA